MQKQFFIKKLLLHFVLIIIISFLASCGSGGGGSSESSAPSVSSMSNVASTAESFDDEVMKSSAETTVIPSWANGYFSSDSDGISVETEEERAARVASSVDSLFDSRSDEVKVHLIVSLKTSARFIPEGFISGADKQAQRDRIGDSVNSVINNVRAKSVDFESKPITTFTTVPVIALEATKDEALLLAQQSNVADIFEDVAVAPDMAESNPLIGSSTAWGLGFSGSGQTVAVLDTGVSKTHPFLSGKVVSEACYSKAGGSGSGISLCPGGVTSSTAVGSGVNCSATIGGCDHGTHVAGTIAGNNGSIYGVAKDAKLIAIQVFTNINGSARSYTSDQIKALERVYALRNTYSIASVNMSLGGDRYYSACDSDPTKIAIDNLKSVGIATVIASGNDGYSDSVSAPGCISTAVTVGSVGDGSNGSVADAVSSFSNSAAMIDLLAPGQYIYSSVPSGGYANFQGTSMATPHVAGAFAVMKSVNTSATVDEIESALKSSGKAVTDSKNNIVKPRIRLNLSVYAMGKGTVRVDISPANAVNDGAQWKLDSGDWQNSGTTLSDILVGSHTVSFKGITDSDTSKMWSTPSPTTVTISADGDSVTGAGTYTEVDKPMAASDINNDNKSEMLIRNLTNSQVLYQYMNMFAIDSYGYLTYFTGTIAKASPNTYDLRAIADSNADGKADVLYQKKADGSFLLWTLDGATITAAGSVQTAAGTVITTPSTTTFAAYADVDGDKKADIIRVDSSGKIVIWLLDGSTFISSSVVKDSGGNVVTFPIATFAVVGAGDADGDGKADILFRSKKDGSFAIWFMDGQVMKSRAMVTTPAGTVILPSVSSWAYVGFKDMDGDGKSDILLRNNISGAFFVMKLEGSQAPERRYLLDTDGVNYVALSPKYWKSADLLDIDGNGMYDIMLRHSTTGRYFCYRINYPGTISRGYITGSDGTTLSYSWSAWLSDF